MKQPRNERCKQHIEALIAQVSAFREDISKAYENPETYADAASFGSLPAAHPLTCFHVAFRDIKASILLARIRSFAEQREESEARMIAHTKALKDACETLAEELNSVVNNQLLELEAAFPDEAFAKTTPDAPSPAK